MQNSDFLSYFSFFLILLDKQKITFNELIRFLEHIVAEQTSKSEVRCVYNVFDPEKKGQVPIIELYEALERMYGHNITVDEIETILSMGDGDKDGCLNEEGIVTIGNFNIDISVYASSHSSLARRKTTSILN